MADNHTKIFLENQVEAAKKREALEAKIAEQLRTDEKFVNYFKQFDPESVEEYIDYYAQEKADWYEKVANYWHLTENKNSKWYKSAIETINEIASKKVYNQMCSWLNREAAFEGIEVSRDWDYWLRNPLYFKHAEPVTQAEVDAYITYVETYPEEYEGSLYTTLDSITPKLLWREHQSKEEESEEDDKLETYAGFFRYYDRVFQTEQVQWASLERIKKEAYYQSISKNIANDNTPPAEKVPYVAPPYLDYEAQWSLLEQYVKEYESYENKIAFEGHQWSKKTQEFLDMAESALYDLQDIKELVAVPSHEDWREGLILAKENYERRKLLEALPAAFEEYQILLEHQLGFEDWLAFKGTKSEDDEYIQQYKADILAGRKLLNEPENFDF